MLKLQSIGPTLPGILAMLAASIGSAQAQTPPVDGSISGPGHLVSYALSYSSDSDCTTSDVPHVSQRTKEILRGEALPLVKFTCQPYSLLAADGSDVDVSETIQLTDFSIAGDDPPPAALKRDGSGYLINYVFTPAWQRTINIAADFRVDIPKPLSFAEQPVGFSVTHQDLYQYPESDTGTTTPFSNGTAPVRLSAHRSIPSIWYHDQDFKNNFVTNTIQITFGSANHNPRFTLYVTAKYTFDPADSGPDSILITREFPAPTEPLISSRTPKFVAEVAWKLGSASKGEVSLQLSDKASGGNVLRFGDTSTPVSSGNGTAGTGGSPLVIAPFDLDLSKLATDNQAGYGSVFLTAILSDRATGKILKTSDPIEYRTQPASIKLTTQCLGGGPDLLYLNRVYSLQQEGDHFEGTSGARPGDCQAQAAVDFRFTGSPAQLSLVISNKASDGAETGRLGIPIEESVNPPAGTRVTHIAPVPANSFVPALALRGQLTNSVSGQKLVSDPIAVPVQSVFVDSCTPNTSDPRKRLDPSNPKVTCHGRYIARTPGLHLERTLRTDSNPYIFYQRLQDDLAVDREGQFTDTFSGYLDDIDGNAESVIATYGLASDLLFGSVAQGFGGSFAILSKAELKANAVSTAARATLDVDQVPPGKSTSVQRADQSACEVLAFLGVDCTNLKRSGYPPGSSTPLPQARTQDAGGTPGTGILGIYSSWTFDPTLPPDGTFQARLTLNYAGAVLPTGNPVFDESKLQIVSIDATGRLATYATTLDTVNKTATAQINSLEPWYSLAMVGVSPTSTLNIPVVSTSPYLATTLSFFNTAATSANLSASVFTAAGAGSAPVKKVAPPSGLASFTSSELLPGAAAGFLGWGQATTDSASDSPSVTGVEWLASRRAFEVLPFSGASGSQFLFTDVELGDDYTTEFHIANTAPVARRIKLDLHGQDGALVGSVTQLVPPQGVLVASQDTLFPKATPPFSGYVLLTGDGVVSATSLLLGNNSVAALNGQPVPQTGAPSTLYAALPGTATFSTRLNLVNPSTQDTQITVQAYNPDGSVSGRLVGLTLLAGQNYNEMVQTLFPPGATGALPASLVITSSTGGIAGDISFGDLLGANTARASLPLTASPIKASLLPFLGRGTTSFALANNNPASAHVTIRLIAPDGSTAGSAAATAPSSGGLWSSIGALIPGAASLDSGYFVVGSDQPLSAFALYDPGSGDIAALPAQPGPSIPISTPAISVTSSSLDFGQVTAGQTKDLAFSVINAGPGDATVTGIAGAQKPFSLVGSQTPFSLPAGSAKIVTIRFSPDTAGLATATLSIATDAGRALTVSLTGTGVGPAAPSISVTPNSLDFGDVLAGQSKSLNLTVANTGKLTLNVSAIASATASFKATPSSAFAVAPGASVVVAVQFAPASPGSQSGTLTIASNDPNSPSVKIALTGNGVAPPCTFVLSATSASLPASGGSGTLGVTASAPSCGWTATSNAAFIHLGAVTTTSAAYTVDANTVSAPRSGTITAAGLTFTINQAAAATVLPPSLSAAPGVNFGSVASGRTKASTITLTNTGAGPLHITSLAAAAPFSVTAPAATSSAPLTLAPSATTTINLLFSPSAAGGQVGSLRILSDDPAHPTLSIALSGTAFNPASVLLSDSFNRANATTCSLGKADQFAGGSGNHYYLPDWPSASGPIGASIVSGALQSNGLDFGGVQLTANSNPCASGANGEKLPQDLDIIVDLLVPASPGLVTEAGPYFRSRAAAPGDGLIGGTSSGYWVELYSTGEVKVYGFNPFLLIAAAPASSAFDASQIHTLESAAHGATLKVTLDGVPVTFTQSGASTAAVTISASSSNDGAVGISFGAEANRGKAGGQRASNLVILSN